MAKQEKATITFEHSDGRKIIVRVENKEGLNETVMLSDFGDIPPEGHSPGIHGDLYAKFMSNLIPFAKEKEK